MNTASRFGKLYRKNIYNRVDSKCSYDHGESITHDRKTARIKEDLSHQTTLV